MMRTISGGGGNETTTTTTVEAESEEASSATATSSATSASASLRRPSAVLRLRSPAVDAPKPAKIPLFSFASLPSPFVSLTVFSALVLLLVPSEFLLPAQRAADQTAVEDNPRKGGDFFAFLDPSEEFSCGGGPLSYLAASMISISCDRHSIHLCCEIHDECYEHRHINQTVCDDQFCSCLDTIRSSAYCETVAQPGLCLATRTFGHLFHWSSNCTAEAVEANGGQLPPECSMLLGQPPPDVANQPQLEIVVAVDEQPEVRGKEAKPQHKNGNGTSRETGIDS